MPSGLCDIVCVHVYADVREGVLLSQGWFPLQGDRFTPLCRVLVGSKELCFGVRRLDSY